MTKPLTACPRCGSSRTTEVPCEPGSVHHARLVCQACGRFRKWLPRSVVPTPEPPPEILALVHRRRLPCILVGSEGQRRAARSIRQTLLFRAGRAKRPDLVALLRCVRAASWFLANRAGDVGRLRWPKPSQLEWVVTGACPACGGPAYDGESACSEECADELAVRVP